MVLHGAERSVGIKSFQQRQRTAAEQAGVQLRRLGVAVKHGKRHEGDVFFAHIDEPGCRERRRENVLMS